MNLKKGGLKLNIWGYKNGREWKCEIIHALKSVVLTVIQLQSLPCIIYAPVAARKIHFRVTILTVMSGNDHIIFCIQIEFFREPELYHRLRRKEPETEVKTGLYIMYRDPPKKVLNTND